MVVHSLLGRAIAYLPPYKHKMLGKLSQLLHNAKQALQARHSTKCGIIRKHRIYSNKRCSVYSFHVSCQRKCLLEGGVYWRVASIGRQSLIICSGLGIIIRTIN